MAGNLWNLQISYRARSSRQWLLPPKSTAINDGRMQTRRRISITQLHWRMYSRTRGGVVDASILCAAILHDTIEDTKTTADELRQLFGEKVASIVLEVTDDKSLAKEVRKEEQVRHAPHISTEAKLVKLADKICNLRDILVSPPADWSAERKQAYFDWAARVVAGLRGVHSGLETVFDGLFSRQSELF